MQEVELLELLDSGCDLGLICAVLGGEVGALCSVKLGENAVRAAPVEDRAEVIVSCSEHKIDHILGFFIA